MLSRQEEEQERRETLENDLKVLQQRGSTFHQHALAHLDDVGGRFATEQRQTVVGADGPPRYPQLPSSSPWSGSQPQPPDEPPLGFPIDQIPTDEPSTPPVSVEGTDDPADAPLSGSGSATPSSDSASEPAGSSPSKSGDGGS